MRHRVAVVLGLLSAVVLLLAATAYARGASVMVKPASGTSRKSFSITFTAPQDVGTTSGSALREYLISATGSTGSRCQSDESVTVRHARSHARVRVRLTPGRRGWCAGRFAGSVEELQTPKCPPVRLCPEYMVLLRTVGRFHFRVRSSRASA